MPSPSTRSTLGYIQDAPPPFFWEGKSVVPIAFSRYELSLDLNTVEKRAVGRASIDLSMPQPGAPLLDMLPEATKIELDGQTIPVGRFPQVTPPDSQAPVRVLDIDLPTGAHQVNIEYELTEDTVSFHDNGVQLDFFMTDLDERGYLEQHAPANMEFNQFPLTVNIAVSGSSSIQLFTNGNATAGSNQWQVEFPHHFTASSFFLHLSDRAFQVRTDTFNGQGRAIPLTAYGQNLGNLLEAIDTAKSVLAELENTFGAYAHSRLTMYIIEDLEARGMEYCGATMASLPALAHEILHSWFARGVMPSNGNAGWIDEGIARWRDYGYPTRPPNPNREPTQLAGFSPYRRHTPANAYRDGSMLLSELDNLFRRGNGTGLRPVLKALYDHKKLRQITTEYFKTFLEGQTGHNIGPVFDRFVYGNAAPAFSTSEYGPELPSRHQDIIQEVVNAPPLPRGFTRSELNALR